MRIAIVSEGFFPEVSGVTIAVERHIDFLAARGHEILLVHPRYPDDVRGLFRTAREPVVRAERFEFDSEALAPHRPETRAPTRRGANEVDAALDRFRPAAVMYHNPDRLVPDLSRPWRRRRVAGLAAADRAGAVAVPIIHTLLPLYVERSAQWYWRTRPLSALARRIWTSIYNDHFRFAVTVDVAARDYARSAGVTVPILAGAWNGVDTSVFHPRDVERIPGGPLRIISVGRLVREKNAHLLVPLVHALRAAGVSFELVIVGDGPVAPDLARDLGAASDVIRRGWLAPEAIADELARSDVYLSLSDTESFSLTAEEALATGVPVIAPDVIGFERLGGHELGFLFPGSWLDASGMTLLARRIRDATAPERLATWAANARASAAERSWSRALGSFAEHLSRETRLEF
jgi:phosphatidylinositol alpha 1,6-mannosyltransferase